MADTSQALSWAAFLAIGLATATIPTYAISVVFLGRETRRTILDRERRQKDLGERLRRLTKSVQSGPSVEALKKEIAQYEADIKWLTGRSNSLSVKGAFLYPFSLYRETAEAVEECLEEWKKRGSLRKDFDAHMFAKGLVALYGGMTVHLAIGTEPPEVRKIFAGFLDAVEQGILRK